MYWRLGAPQEPSAVTASCGGRVAVLVAEGVDVEDCVDVLVWVDVDELVWVDVDELVWVDVEVDEEVWVDVDVDEDVWVVVDVDVCVWVDVAELVSVCV